jgi:hypothetical protein
MDQQIAVYVDQTTPPLLLAFLRLPSSRVFWLVRFMCSA